MQQKTKKVTITIEEQGHPKEIEVEVPDVGDAGWGPVDRMRYINQSRTRMDALAKVTGRARYTYDLNLPGMLYGRVLRSAHPRARVRRIDTSKAAALPGVKAILLPGEAHTVFTQECRYAGQEVAAVAATSADIAEDAIHLIDVEYEILPFVVALEDARKPEAVQVHSDRKNVSDPQTREQGDITAGFAEADVVVEATYHCQVHTHTALETHGAVTRWEGDQLTVWASTQGVFSVRGDLARHFGIEETRIRVITEHMGGGFGAKLSGGRDTVICALLAKKSGAPVKLMLNRKEEHLTTGNRPSSVQQVKLGAKRDGKLVAYQRYNYGTPGMAGSAGIPAAPYLYDVPNWKVEQVDVFTHAGPAAALRAPGHPQAAFSMESIMDEIAEKLGMDPLDLRLKNDPHEVRRKMLEMGAEKIGWRTRRKANPDMGAERHKRGMGLGSCTWGGGGGRTRAFCAINPDGSVEVRCGTQDIGTGTRTIIHMIAGEEFGIEPESIKVLIGDTALPFSGGSGGSTTCASVSPAIKFTTMMAKLKLFETVAPKFGVDATALEAREGKVYVKTDPSRSMTWQQATALLQDGPVEFQGSWVPGYSDSGVPGTQFVEVEVDTQTGLVKILKVVAVQNSGLVINPLTWESQINGGVIMGICYGLYEDRIMDPPTGYMVNANMEDYRLVGSMEAPEIEILRYDEPQRGTIGIGEPPIIPTAGAIANAIYNACGARVRALPMTPDRVLAALAAVKEG